MAEGQNQFVVPQFLDVESKIMGPITVRQFVIFMVTGLISVIFYKLFDFALFLLIFIPLAAVAFAFAFIKIHGQGLHLVMLNVVQTLRKPSLRVWNKWRTDAELKAKLRRKDAPPPPPSLSKSPLSGSRLRDLSLVVNTGGVYLPDDTV